MIDPVAKKNRIPRHKQTARKEYMKQWTAATASTPEGKAKLARWHWSAILKNKYGITADDYDRMLVEQGGVCAICKRPPKKRRLSVDHNHQTKVIRGLLCFTCNYHLVGRTPSVEKAKSLLAYLERNGGFIERQVKYNNPPGRPNRRKAAKLRSGHEADRTSNRAQLVDSTS